MTRPIPPTLLHPCERRAAGHSLSVDCLQEGESYAMLLGVQYQPTVPTNQMTSRHEHGHGNRRHKAGPDYREQNQRVRPRNLP